MVVYTDVVNVVNKATKDYHPCCPIDACSGSYIIVNNDSQYQEVIESK